MIYNESISSEKTRCKFKEPLDIKNFVSDENKFLMIQKTKRIISQLKASLTINKVCQNHLIKKYHELTEKQNVIENTLDKIKKLAKAKQKKHVKYVRYIPLSKIYYYSPKKNPFYYMLLDIIIKCKKKQKSSNPKNMPVVNNREINRYKSSKLDDMKLNNILLYEDQYELNWYNIGLELKKTPLEVFVRYLELSKFYEYKKWTLQEDSILKKSILYYGPKNWQQISYCLDGKF